ncbi:MAG: methyl-accepting chemotaxis protein [Candidatus Methylomirabilia bacterium]
MNVLNNVKIGTKLMVSFTIIIVLLLGVAVMGYINTKNINDGMTTMYMDRLKPIHDLGQAQVAFYEIRGEVFKFVLLYEDIGKTDQVIKALVADLETNFKEYRATFLVKEEREELANFDLAWAAYQKTVANILALTKAGRTQEAQAMMVDGAVHYVARKAVAKSLDQLILINEKIADELNNQGDVTFANATRTSVVLSVVAVLLAVAIAIALSRGIAKPLTAITGLASRIAAGDLSVSLADDRRRDEIGILGRAFRLMVENLRRSTAEIREAVNLLGSTASEIMASTTQVATGTAETSTAIAETTTTVEEVRQAAQLSSQKAKNVADSAQRVSQVGQIGQKAVEEVVAGIEHIRTQMESIASTIVRLSEQTQSIGGIIAAVTDIADQSNLLAVNAAIEATRAGEQGKAFGVVAQEIKSLAEQSKQATLQVRSILSDVQRATSAAVMATEQGSKSVEAGVRQSAQAGEAITRLAESSQEAVQTATQIVASSQQQVVGMDQIGLAMENINKAGAQTAASTTQVETAARNLDEMGQKLKALVEQFKG